MVAVNIVVARRWVGVAPSPAWRWQQRAWLVNVKLKWVKDRSLDRVVSRERHLRHALLFLHRILNSNNNNISSLGSHSARDFLGRFPALFRESPPNSVCLTDDALRIHSEELQGQRAAEADLVDRLRRLLMLTATRSLPLHTVDQLAWDMGLPLGYQHSLLPRYPNFFDIVRSHGDGDDRLWLSLCDGSWDPHLAVSHLQRSNNSELEFPISFPRGYGLRRKCAEWLREWQTLPYTSPYADASALDPRTDVSEKRNVGVFHELLHLTIARKTERRNLSNLRRPLGLPQKFTKVFERHPGIFYISYKLATQTIVLREAYTVTSSRVPHAIEKHPLQAVREKYAELIRVGTSPAHAHAHDDDYHGDHDNDDGGHNIPVEKCFGYCSS